MVEEKAMMEEEVMEEKVMMEEEEELVQERLKMITHTHTHVAL